MVMRALSVWMNGVAVGVWSVESKTNAHEFKYHDEWVSSPLGRPISFSLPLRPANAPYREREGARVESFFENLLPDNPAIRERIRHRFGLPSIRAFDLLSCVGRDSVGALQILPEDDVPKDIHAIEGDAATDERIARLLSDTVSPEFAIQSGQADDEFRISIAGAQEKTALLWHNGHWMIPRGSTPTTHILKMPIGQVQHGIDLTASVSNEWTCLQLLDAFGLNANKVQIKRFMEHEVLVVERFDRRFSSDRSWILRLPQEDFCQATGTPPEKKYQSDGGPGIRAINDILQGSTKSLEDRQYFLKSQVLYWMLCAIDGHAKNFSIFLLPNNGFGLTPSYDVMSAYPVLGTQAGMLSPHKVKMAMAVEDANRHYRWNEIQYRHWIAMGKKCGLESECKQIIEDLVQAAPAAIESVKARLPDAVPVKIADSIFSGVQNAANKLEMQRKLGLSAEPGMT